MELEGEISTKKYKPDVVFDESVDRVEGGGLPRRTEDGCRHGAHSTKVRFHSVWRRQKPGGGISIRADALTNHALSKSQLDIRAKPCNAGQMDRIKDCSKQLRAARWDAVPND